jgi:hypothetical protein
VRPEPVCQKFEHILMLNGTVVHGVSRPGPGTAKAA